MVAVLSCVPAAASAHASGWTQVQTQSHAVQGREAGALGHAQHHGQHRRIHQQRQQHEDGCEQHHLRLHFLQAGQQDSAACAPHTSSQAHGNSGRHSQWKVVACWSFTCNAHMAVGCAATAGHWHELDTSWNLRLSRTYECVGRSGAVSPYIGYCLIIPMGGSSSSGHSPARCCSRQRALP